MSDRRSLGAGLQLVDVTVRFGSTVAVDAVSLDVAPGEIVAVIGPSGSGKSTLLRAIAGLEPLAGGTIEAGGRSLAGVPTHRRDLGLMFQDHALFPHLSVAGNVGFGLDMQRVDAGERGDRTAELLDLVGLASFGERSVGELSGGEAQRVALARALAPQPQLLMLDEPFGSLDRVLRAQLTGEVRRLLGELGQTALHVTHDQEEAFALADRVAVLAEGRVSQVGTPEELWRRPASLFVAEFLGHPNRWMVTVDADGAVRLGSVLLGNRRADGSELSTARAVPTAPVSALPVGTLRVIAPVAAIEVDDAGPLTATVDDARFVDGRYRIDAVAGVAGSEPVVFETRRRLVPGDRVRLSIDVDRLHAVGAA